MNYDDFGWPDENADGEIWTYVVLYLAAAASGAWVAVWGLFGLAWRPPLHLGGLALLVAVGLEVAANVVQVNYFSDLGLPVDLGDQADSYVDRITFESRGPNEGRAYPHRAAADTAVLPLLAWLVVLFSGAGRKRKPTPYNTAYAQPQQYQQPQQPYHQPQQPQPQQPARSSSRLPRPAAPAAGPTTAPASRCLAAGTAGGATAASRASRRAGTASGPADEALPGPAAGLLIPAPDYRPPLAPMR